MSQTTSAGFQQNNAALNNKYGPQEIQPTAFLPAAVNRAENVRERLNEILQRLEHLRERTMGPQPGQIGTGANGSVPQPMGSVHLLSMVQEHQVSLLGAIDAVLRELDALA